MANLTLSRLSTGYSSYSYLLKHLCLTEAVRRENQALLG